MLDACGPHLTHYFAMDYEGSVEDSRPGAFRCNHKEKTFTLNESCLLRCRNLFP